MQEQDVQANLKNAILCSDKKSIRTALQSGADANAIDDSGWTPLMMAVLRGNLEICELLLLAGANPTTATIDGIDALTLAASQQKVAVVDLFLTHVKKQFSTAIASSATNINSTASIDPIQDLLQKGLEIYDEAVSGLTPKEAEILRLRFPRRGARMTLEQIGQKHQLSRQRISQIIGKAIRKIKHPLISRRLDAVFTDIWNYAKDNNLDINDLKLKVIHMDQGLSFMFLIYCAGHDQ